MSPRLRLTLVVVLLVVLPTAVLSVLAARALRASELFLRRELEIAALAEVDRVADAGAGAVRAELARLREALSGTTFTSGAYELGAIAEPLERDSDLVASVFVFGNPWGFLYPVASPDELTALLRQRVASASDATGPLQFSEGGRAYAFDRIGDRPAIYAGFEIDPDALAFRLAEALDRPRDGRFILEAVRGDGIRFRAGADRGSVVIVDDPFAGAAPAQPAMAADSFREGDPFFSVRLGPPLDTYAVAVYLRDPGRIRGAEALRSRITAWGITVLALGACAGAWIVVREAAVEIRRARSRSDMVVGISHDLRTPVSAMKMLAETLYLGRVSDGARQKEFLGAIVREAERLNHLVERVLFFVRFGQRALHYALAEMEPAGLVRKGVEVFGARFEGGPPEAVPDVRVEASPLLPAVRVDESAMTQVLLNLLDNAEKYSRGSVSGVGGRLSEEETGSREGDPQCATLQGGPRPPGAGSSARQAARSPLRIDVTLDSVRRRCRLPGCVREWVRIAVRDYGAGMERTVARKVFREFYRGPGAGDRNVSGLGLGLALCRHVVRAHGGRMRVISAPVRGSTFEVWLPVR